MWTLSHINNLEKELKNGNVIMNSQVNFFQLWNIYFEFVNILTVLLRHVINYSLKLVGQNEILKP